MSLSVRSDLLELIDWDWSSQVKFAPVAATTPPNINFCEISIDKGCSMVHSRCAYEPSQIKVQPIPSADRRPSPVKLQERLHPAKMDANEKEPSTAIVDSPPASIPPSPALKPTKLANNVDPYVLAIAQGKEFTITFHPDYAKKKGMKPETNPVIRELLEKHKLAANWVEKPKFTLKDRTPTISDLTKDASPRNLCVAGFYGDTPESGVRHYFARFGYIDRVQNIKNAKGNFVGYSFVRFVKEEDAQRALEVPTGKKKAVIKLAKDVINLEPEEIQYIMSQY